MKQVTIPAQWLQELIALCGPEDHELRERVMKSADPAPADALATATGLPAQAVEGLTRDQATWCSYIAGMIGCYLKEPDDSTRVKAIAGIIERRLWALPAPQAQADARDALDQSGWVSVDDALPEHAISEVLILQMYFEADGTARMHDKEDPALGHLYNIAKGHCHQDGPVPRWSGRSGDNFGLLFRGGWRVVAWRHIHPASNYVSHIAAIAAANGV